MFIRPLKTLGVAALLLSGASAVAQTVAPLADAAEKQDRARIAALLNKAAAVNAHHADGMTALHWAPHPADLPLVTLLLKSAADAKAANRYGVTPLSLACRNGNTELVELLLKAGADVKTTLR